MNPWWKFSHGTFVRCSYLCFTLLVSFPVCLQESEAKSIHTSNSSYSATKVNGYISHYSLIIALLM